MNTPRRIGYTDIALVVFAALIVAGSAAHLLLHWAVSRLMPRQA